MALTVYTAGEVLTASSLNDNLTFAAANPPATPGGLELVSTTTIGSAVSFVTVTGAFSATFDNYEIVFNGGSTSVAQDFFMELGAVTTGYSGGSFLRGYNAIVSGFDNQNNAARILIGRVSQNGTFGRITVLGPNLAARTVITFINAQALATTGLAQSGAGFEDSATQHTAFTLRMGSGNMTGGTIRVYGYKN